VIIIGIDPGTTGALAVIDHNIDDSRRVEVQDLPTMAVKGNTKRKHRKVDGRALMLMLSDIRQRWGLGEPITFAVEDVRFLAPGLAGGSAIASLAHSRGVIEGVITACGYRCEWVDAQRWKKRYGLTSDKHAGLVCARRLFPGALESLKLAKHHNRAEALLIANYALAEFA
jgi:hypothetical protein